MTVVSCLTTEHNLWLVLLAAVVCVVGAWVFFDLIQRARERHGLQKHGWTFLSAVAFGCSAWCTHFIAMLAYRVKAPVTYDPLLTLTSLLIVIAGSAIGINLLLRRMEVGPLLGGAVIGLAVALMHYAGMWAFHVNGIIEWDPYYVVASIVFSLGLAALAMQTFMSGTTPLQQYGALALLVGSVLLLHFTGMTAMTVIPLATDAATAAGNAVESIAVAIAAAGLLIIATGVTSQLIDSRASWETMQRLEKLAHFDQLTGLPNRANFLESFKRLMERAENSRTAIGIVVFDLDNFKTINDLRGHEVGDQALKAITQNISRLIEDGELIARIGGDEFVATKPFRKRSELESFVRRLEAALFRPVQLDDLQWDSRASLGVSIYPNDAQDPERLLIYADLAMYRAKDDPMRPVCYYEPEMDQALRDRRLLAQDLRRSVERGELYLDYQVQVAVSSSRVCGYEALLRWNHPDRGHIAPSEFIPLSEETGSIVEIGDWVLRTACDEAVRWTLPHKVAVNISSIQMSGVDLCGRVAQILNQTGLPPERLELEITETAIIINKERTLHQLHRLRELGVTIAIDDFGTGYSSLDTLRSFPFDKIKLDRSFMREIEHSPQSIAFLRAVMALGRSLTTPILAEGVELLRQFEILRREGCDEAQGYLLGKPSRTIVDIPRHIGLDPSAAA